MDFTAYEIMMKYTVLRLTQYPLHKIEKHCNSTYIEQLYGISVYQALYVALRGILRMQQSDYNNNR